MPRPRSLTSDAIAVAALDIIDREGLPVLSMRTVAAALGVSTMALYRYVDDREQVERLVVDLVLGRVDLTPPARSSWRRQISVLLERARAAVADHPRMTPLTLAHRHRSDAVRRLGEAILTILAEADFNGVRRVIAFRALLAYLIGALQTAHHGPLAGEGTVALSIQDTFPLLAETAQHARGVTPEREFSAGLEIMLRGMESAE